MTGLFGHKEEQPFHFDGTALLQQSLHIFRREYRQHFHHIIEVGNVVILRSEVQTLHKRPFRGRDRQLENPLSGGGDSGVGIKYFGGKQPERNSPIVFSEPKAQTAKRSACPSGGSANIRVFPVPTWLRLSDVCQLVY